MTRWLLVALAAVAPAAIAHLRADSTDVSKRDILVNKFVEGTNADDPKIASWSPDESFPIPAYVVSKKKLFEAHLDKLKALGFEPIRVHPHNFWRELPPCEPFMESERPKMKWAELGVFESHRDAWRQIAASGRTALVLEADWTISNQSSAALRQDFRETVFRMAMGDEDLVWAGRCGAYCTTAYFIKPRAAQLIAKANMCDEHVPLDMFLNHQCGRESFRRASTLFRDKTRGVEYLRRLSCGRQKMYPVEYFPGLYGDGPFFQDRHIKGMHADTGHWKTDNHFIAADMPHETYSFRREKHSLPQSEQGEPTMERADSISLRRYRTTPEVKDSGQSSERPSSTSGSQHATNELGMQSLDQNSRVTGESEKHDQYARYEHWPIMQMIHRFRQVVHSLFSARA